MCPGDEIDDLVQDCFVKIWKAMAQYRGEASVKTWVTRIAINTAHDYFRRKGRIPETEEFSDGVPAEINAFSDREAVQYALSRLSIPHREVLVLHVIEQNSLEEVSEIIGAPVGTVKSRLHHAREEMKKILLKHGVKYE